jgi:hypothetical protein
MFSCGVTHVHGSGRYGTSVDGAFATDEYYLNKAMQRKVAQNMDSPSTVASSKSFLYFPSPVMYSKLNRVGMKLGSNENTMNVSTRVLRHMDFDHLTFIPKASIVFDTS